MGTGCWLRLTTIEGTKVTDQADTMVQVIERDGHHTLILRATRVVARLRPAMLAAEHPILAHPGPHHRILRGTVGESLTRAHRDAAAAPGDAAGLGGDKQMKTMQPDGILRRG